MGSRRMGIVKRPRFYWIGWPFEECMGVQSLEAEGYRIIDIEAEVPEESVWLADGADWKAGTEDEPHATFMRAIPRQRPPEKPAGLHKTPEEARARMR